MKINNKQIKSLFLMSLVGSGVGQEENSNNQTEITYPNETNLNSLPKLATNLTAGENDSDPTLIFAGYPISFGTYPVTTGGPHYTAQCTAGFMVVNTHSNSTPCYAGNDNDGFLTSTFCFPSITDFGNFPISPQVYSWDRSTLLGLFADQDILLNDDKVKFDYVYVSNRETAGVVPEVQLAPYAVGKDRDLYPVAGLAYVELGYKVCAYGAVSGYNCGNLTELNVKLAIPRPYSTSEGFQEFKQAWGLGKVDLGTNGFYTEADVGGPVYTESNIGDRKVVWALGHITTFDNNDPNHKLLYYTPLDKVLPRILSFSGNCTYTLMTANVTNAEKFQEFQAQVEIPPKN